MSGHVAQRRVSLCAILLLVISRQTKVRLYLEYKRLFGRLAGIETEKNSFLPSLSPTYIVHWRTAAAAQTSGFFPYAKRCRNHQKVLQLLSPNFGG